LVGLPGFEPGTKRL